MLLSGALGAIGGLAYIVPPVQTWNFEVGVAGAGSVSYTHLRVYDTNGTQLSQQILSTEVIKEPVTEKIVVGTKKQTKEIGRAHV